MKNNNLLNFSIGLLVIGFLFTACKKEDETNQEEVASNYIKMKIDNNSETIYKDNFSAMTINDKLIIGVSDNTTDGDIQLTMDSSIANGTYTSNFLISHGVNGQTVFATVTNVSNKSLTVTTHDTANRIVKGNFSLDFTDNTTQTSRHAQGSFEVKYN